MSLNAIVMDDEEAMTGELMDFRSLGGSALLDVSTPGLRTDPLALKRISTQSGVHIIAATGLYAQDSWPERFHDFKTKEIEGYLTEEIKYGINETDVKPGHIKIAIEGNFIEPEVNALRAACRVAMETGLSLTIHQGMTLGPEDGFLILDILEEEKMDLARTVIAHADARFVTRNIRQLVLEPESRQLNLDIPKKLLDRGVNISIDCFGHYWDAEPLGMTNINDWQRIAGLFSLISAGYSKQLVIGTDSFIKFLLKRFGGDGYCRLLTYAVPMLKEVGVSQSDIDDLTIHNPARLLAF